MFRFMNRGKAFYRNLILLAIPIILQNLLTSSLGLIDTFMIGLLGETELAGVTLANIPIFVVQLVIFGIQSGSSVLISQHWGKRDTDTINRVMGIGFCVAGVVSALFALIMFFLPYEFMSLFGNDAQVVAIAARYAKIVGFSYFFDSFVLVYMAAHRSMENPLLGLMLQGVAMVSNTGLNALLIFGLLGFPALGVEGGALATLLARIIGFVIMLIHARTNRTFRPKPALFLHPSRELVNKFIKYSGPVVLNETFWGLGTSLYATIMGHMDGSKEILAAYAISGNVEKLCTVGMFAVAATAAIIVGREIGAGNKETVFEVGSCLNTVAILAGVGSGILLITLLHVFIQPVLYPLFDLSPTATEISIMMLTMICLFLPIRSFCATLIVGVLRGGGDVNAAALLDLVPLWCCSVPLVALTGLVLRLDIFWVYLSIFVEESLKFTFGMKRFLSRQWIHDLTVM